MGELIDACLTCRLGAAHCTYLNGIDDLPLPVSEVRQLSIWHVEQALCEVCLISSGSMELQTRHGDQAWGETTGRVAEPVHNSVCDHLHGEWTIRLQHAASRAPVLRLLAARSSNGNVRVRVLPRRSSLPPGRRRSSSIV